MSTGVFCAVRKANNVRLVRCVNPTCESPGAHLAIYVDGVQAFHVFGEDGSLIVSDEYNKIATKPALSEIEIADIVGKIE
jgi:hypothetical protein